MKECEIKAFCDPAGDSNIVSKTVCRSAIVVVARDWANRYYVPYAWAARASTDAIIQKVFDVYAKWHTMPFGIEVAGQQSLFCGAIETVAKLKRIPITLLPVKQPTAMKKEFRIRTIIQPILAEHRLFIDPSLTELKTEMAAFPTGQTVDIVDALASCINMFPPLVTTARGREEAVTDYEEFLRDEGLEEEDIQERLIEEFGRDSLYSINRPRPKTSSLV